MGPINGFVEAGVGGWREVGAASISSASMIAEVKGRQKTILTERTDMNGTRERG